jgi:hypothetical protein
MPLFSVRDLFARERPRSENGDLDEGSVMVCDIQPLAGAEFAARVGANIRSGINYLYFFHACDDTIEQVFRALQIIVVSGVAPEVDLNDVQARRAVVKEKTHLVVEALQDMCETKGLRIGFLYQEPNFCFRLHNAQDAKRARLYARYRDLGYVLWAKEEAAAALLRAPADFLEDREDTTILVQLKAGGPQLSADADIMRSLADKVRKYFPGAEDAVMQICVGSTGR